MTILKSCLVVLALCVCSIFLYATSPAHALECGGQCAKPYENMGPMVFSFCGLPPNLRIAIQLDDTASFNGKIHKGVEKMNIQCQRLYFMTPSDAQPGENTTISVGVEPKFGSNITGIITAVDTDDPVRGHVQFHYSGGSAVFYNGNSDTVDGQFFIRAQEGGRTCFPCDCTVDTDCPPGYAGCYLRDHMFQCCLINPYD